MQLKKKVAEDEEQRSKNENAKLPGEDKKDDQTVYDEKIQKLKRYESQRLEKIIEELKEKKAMIDVLQAELDKRNNFDRTSQVSNVRELICFTN